jgi:hypothetical protein
MEIGDHWGMIRKVFNEAYQSCYHFAVATATRVGRHMSRPSVAFF